MDYMAWIMLAGMLSCYIAGIYVGRHWRDFTEEE